MKRAFCLFAAISLLLLGCQQQEEQQPAETGQETGQESMQQQPPPEPQEQAPPEQGMTGETGQATGGAAPAGDLPPAEGEPFVEYITQTDPYKQWELWPGKGEMYEGTEPHGALLTTYVNQTALEAIQQGSGRMPEGAIIVKENYTPEKELVAVTTMYRKPGFDPEGDDWFWAKLMPDGQIEDSGKVKGCIDCHQKARANDWLFTGNLGQPGAQ